MSASKLIDYVQKLLFGSERVEPPPSQLFPILMSLKARKIDIQDTIRNGGLVNRPHMIAGDLDTVLRHFEKDEGEPILHTTLVTAFYNHLSIVLARRERQDPDPPCSDTDSNILTAILKGDTTTKRFEYSCPQFWGRLARRLLQNRRPSSDMVPLEAHPPEGHLRNVLRLYDVTCKMRGEWLNPLSAYLVWADEYVDAVHWHDARTLEAWIRTEPNHSLSRAIVQLVRDVVRHLLDGRRADWMGPHDALDQFLENVSAVQSAIAPVADGPLPPRVVDAFQRLLALARLDSLWQYRHTVETTETATHLLQLTEKVLLLQKLNRELLQKPCRQ